MRPIVTVVVAMAENRVIGRANRLPWHLPADLAHFKAVTIGKPVVMGRLTWESIGRPLPGRTNIVVTSRELDTDRVVAVRSLADALAQLPEGGEACVIGGARLFAEALPHASRIHLTEVHAVVDGDVRFPPLDDGWVEVSRERRPADARNEHPMSFVVLERR